MNNYWKNTKVIVTGAAGFIGSHIVDSLVENGALVTAVVSPATSENKIQRNLGSNLKNIRLVKVDLLDRDKLIDAFKNHDIVYHFAAIDGGREFKLKHPAEIFSKNILMTLNILETARILSVNKVFLMSSIEVYPRNLTGTITESDTETTTLPYIDGYAWAKRTAETAGLLYSREYGINVIIGRAGNIYGPRDYWSSEKSRVMPSFIYKALTNEDIILKSDKNFKIPFLYVEDFAKIVSELMIKQKDSGLFNIVSPQYINLYKLADMIISKTKSRSIVKLQTANKSLNNYKYSLTKLESVLGKIYHTPKFDGIDKTIEYYKNSIT